MLALVDFGLCVRGTTAACQDCATILPFADGYLCVVADGAGGISGGREAAEFVIGFLRSLEGGAPNWCDVLRMLDQQLLADPVAGETTAVVVLIAHGTAIGASVGDSGAWLIDSGEPRELTDGQRRKPLLGSGSALPVAFGPVSMVGRMVVGSDGLFKYVPLSRICELARIPSVEVAAAELIEAARLPTGRLPDDTAVIVAG